MLAFLLFVLGLILGFGVYHFFFRLSQPEKELAAQLQGVQAQFKKYKSLVELSLASSAQMMNQVQTACDQLHDHILKASVDLNQQTEKQSILQPSLHAAPFMPTHPDHNQEEQVTEFQPEDDHMTTINMQSPPHPPKDYA